MMRTLWISLLVIPLFTLTGWVAAQSDKSANLVKMWEINGEFPNPQSVAYDPIASKLFVGNTLSASGVSQGIISRLNSDGTSVEPRWLTGIQAVTGLIYHEGQLMFADLDHLRVADPGTGRLIASYPAPVKGAQLSDIAVGPSGEVFVASNSHATIFRLKDGALIPFIEDARALKTVNSLYLYDRTLITGAESLHTWNIEDGTHLGILAPEDSPIQNIRGISRDKFGNLILALKDDARFWQLVPGGNYRTLSDAAINPGDFTLHPSLGFLFSPTGSADTGIVGVTALRYEQ